jgi:hypothetical protein
MEYHPVCTPRRLARFDCLDVQSISSQIKTPARASSEFNRVVIAAYALYCVHTVLFLRDLDAHIAEVMYA